MSSHSTETSVRYKSLRFLGFPKYRVGDDGSVWSRQYKNWRSLKPGSSGRRGNDYSMVILSKRGEKKVFLVHHLVLFAFVGAKPKGMECCHADGNRRNNQLSNLRWGTRLENHDDRRRHGNTPTGEKNNGSKVTEAIVREIRALAESTKLTHRAIGMRFGISLSQANKIINHKSWSHVQ